MRLPMGGCLPTGQEPRVSPARQALRTASKCKLSNQTFGHHASELEGKAAFIDRHIAELKHLSEMSESPVAAPPSATVMPLAATGRHCPRRAPEEPLSTSCGPWGRERVAGWSAAWTCVGGLLPRDGRSLRRSARTHLAFGCACRFAHCRIRSVGS
jgi:hypothetical protein